MQVESKSLSKHFLIFILILLINTVLLNTVLINCFNVYIFAPYAFYFSYCLIMERLLIKAAFGSEALIRGRRGAYLRADAYKKKCGEAEGAQYSK